MESELSKAERLTIERVRRILRWRGDREELTPQEVEMLVDLMATGHYPDAYLADAVSVARWVR